MYLCYDIKGIQRFIFSVPRLKCVIGASGLIVGFDETSARAAKYGALQIFSGGGRGAFECTNRDAAEAAAEFLIGEAHKLGLDIRIGIDESLSQAAHHADHLHPFCPESLDGAPCAISGLWPSQGAMHPLIRKRFDEASKDRLGKELIEELRRTDRLPQGLHDIDDFRFFRTISADQENDDQQLIDEADASDRAIGNRNRWAIVAMDGNDMGRQFLVATQQIRGDEKRMRHWLKEMSSCLGQCTRTAFVQALAETIGYWVQQRQESTSIAIQDCVFTDRNRRRVLVLPFRPLILGGDDVTMLCHPSLAMRFVESMCHEFESQSGQWAEKSTIKPLWPATGDRLSISAGILFAKVTVPLHMAIPYAESLLASAKGKYRNTAGNGQPTPAAVDWDVVTDTLIDSPAARRNRELRFLDRDLNVEIRLTRRPYRLEPGNGDADIPSLIMQKQQLEVIPRTVRAGLLPALQKPWSERIAYLASLAKRHPELKRQLWEEGDRLGDGWHAEANPEGARVTGLPDALLLLEEEERLSLQKDE